MPPPHEPGATLLGDEEHQQHQTTEKTLHSEARKLPLGFRADPPSILCWIGWVYGALYFPIVQIHFLASNWGNNSPYSGSIKLVRAIGVGITALPLTMDTKARYAAMLQSKQDKWYGDRLSNRRFTWIHALSTLTLGIIEAILLVLAYAQIGPPVFFVPIYIVFSTIWMLGSFVFISPMDGGSVPNTLLLFVAGLAMGIFGGAFTSAAAFGSRSWLFFNSTLRKEHTKNANLVTYMGYLLIWL